MILLSGSFHSVGLMKVHPEAHCWNLFGAFCEPGRKDMTHMFHMSVEQLAFAKSQVVSAAYHGGGVNYMKIKPDGSLAEAGNILALNLTMTFFFLLFGSGHRSFQLLTKPTH